MKRKKQIKKLKQKICLLEVLNASLQRKNNSLEVSTKIRSAMTETNWKRYGFSERRF